MTEQDTVAVRIIGFPLDVQQVSNAWHDELLREFALVALGAEEGNHVPRRLLDLIEVTRANYSEFTDDVSSAQLEMRARGAMRGDFVYEVPRAIADACVELDEALDAAEDYCEDGNLLTMRPAPVISAFRRWVFGEFVGQIRDGAAPTSWDDFVAKNGVSVAV